MRENSHQAVFSLYELSLVADRAAFDAGKKYELSPDLDSYTTLLPPGARVFWNAQNKVLSVANPYCPGAQKQIREAERVPGPFDAGMDMGPDAWSAAARRGAV